MARQIMDLLAEINRSGDDRPGDAMPSWRAAHNGGIAYVDGQLADADVGASTTPPQTAQPPSPSAAPEQQEHIMFAYYGRLALRSQASTPGSRH